MSIAKLCAFFFIFNCVYTLLSAQHILPYNPHIKEIYKTLGTPDKIERGPSFYTWWYGDHYILVYSDRMYGFDNAQELGFRFKPKGRVNKTTLDLDDSINEIITILGTPRRLTKGNIYDVWWYGDEYIKLIKGTIMEYSNAKKLRFRLVPKKPQMDTVVREYTHADDVLRIMGTPDKVVRGVTQDTWWYNDNFIILKHNRVTFINKRPSGQTPVLGKARNKFEDNDVFKRFKYRPPLPRPHIPPTIDSTTRVTKDVTNFK